VIANPKLEAQLRTRNLVHKFVNLAYKAADYPDCCLLLEDGLDCLSTQLEDKLNLSANTLNKSCNEQENVEPNAQQKDEFLAAQLKKRRRSQKIQEGRKVGLINYPKVTVVCQLKLLNQKRKNQRYILDFRSKTLYMLLPLIAN